MQVVPVHFQDLDFRHTFAWCRSCSGERRRRWISYGMPRIRPHLLRNSFYLFRLNPKTGKKEGPLGSGVVLARQPKDSSHDLHLYAVTAYHVAVSGGASIIRLNTKATQPLEYAHRDLEFSPEDWQFIPGGHDIAAIDITDDLREGDWVRATRDVDIVTRDFIRRVKLGLGEDGFMLGLFLPNPGEKYNLPATRFGNVAQLADDQHPIEQGHGISHESHVFDIHSRPGYSGSPVFVYRTPANALTGIEPDGDWTLDTENNVFLALLGIHSGQFQEKAKDKNGAEIQIPSSMTIVVPAWAIIDLLDTVQFKEQREMRERKHQQSDKPKVVPESANEDKPVKDANPQHREDFTALLGEAARKQKQGE